MKAGRISRLLFILLIFFLIPSGQAMPGVDKDSVAKGMKDVRVPFVKNEGQYNKDVSYHAKTFGGSFFITKVGELVYDLPKVEKIEQGVTKEARLKGLNHRVTGGVVIRERLLGAKVRKVTGTDQSEAKVSYFKGNDPKDWISGIETYRKVSLGEVYKGIRLEPQARGGNVEKLFYISPGARPEDIRIEVRGANKLRANEKGELLLDTEYGDVKFTRPTAYQVIDGKRIEREAAYRIIKGQGRLIYSFNVGDYDRTKELVIDPLLASTFLGGSNAEIGIAVTLDSSGNVYVTGYKWLSDYLPITGTFDISFDDSLWDVFVAKLNSNLTTLLALTFLGGSNKDYGGSLAVDSSGNVYVTGSTTSNDYPTTQGAYDTTHNGNSDVFVSKLNSSLTMLLSSTLLGGSNVDAGFAIALDSSGNVYVTGWAGSPNYPTTQGAYDTSHNGQFDVFVSKLNSSLTMLLSSTFLGGSNAEGGNAIALDSSGNVYVTGVTTSTDYPTTQGAYDTSHNGNYNYYGVFGNHDIFLSKLNNGLTVLLASTFLGGSNDDFGGCLAVDSNGNVYVTGETWSPNYPTTQGAYDTSLDGVSDVFVSKLTPTLSQTDYTLTVTKSGTGIGTVTSNPPGINCGTDCSEPYAVGTVVTFTAKASPGSVFANWSGACTGSSKVVVVTMDGDKTCTATFNSISEAELKSYEFIISKGWNLLGSPVSIDLQNQLMDPSILSIWKWENQKGTWSVRLPKLEDKGQVYASAKGFGFLTDIEPGEGFWVNSDVVNTITVQGYESQTPLGVASGWNLLGLKSKQSYDIEALVGDKGSKITSVWKWAKDTWHVYLPQQVDKGASYAQAKGFGVISGISPGEGFWINAKEGFELY